MPAPGQVEDPPERLAAEPSLGSRMVRGTLAQQAGLPVAVVAGLLVTTALARSLTLSEFGAYGFVVALASYLYFVIGTAETAAVNEMAATDSRDQLERAFTRSIIIYAGLGALAGVVVGGGGALLVSVLSFSAPLTRQAQLGCVAVGALTAVGWTTKVFQDYLRAIHRFPEASISEATGNVILAAAVLCALALNAPLWVLMAAGGGLPLYVGTTAMAIVLVGRAGCRMRLRDVSVAELVAFLRFSGGLLVIAASDFVVSSLDRTVVGALRPAPTLGLYEAAYKINGVVRVWVSNLSITLLPVLSRTRADDDRERERDLLIAGARYMLVAAVGPTVTVMILCDRLLETWLGSRYVSAAPTATVFLAWWLIQPNFSAAATLAIVSRRLRQMAITGWATAAVNLVVSVALTAQFGLIGVAIGTLVGYVALVPYFVSFAYAGRGVRIDDLARSAWLPAYGLGLGLALMLLAVRIVLPLDHLAVVVLVVVLSVLGYWGAFYFFLTDPGERALLRSALRRS